MYRVVAGVTNEMAEGNGGIEVKNGLETVLLQIYE